MTNSPPSAPPSGTAGDHPAAGRGAPTLKLLAILALALLVRVGAVFVMGPVDPLMGDAREYFSQSLRIANGDDYTWNRAPGYAAVLAAAQRALMGPSEHLVDYDLLRHELPPDHPGYEEQQRRVRICQGLNVAFSLLAIVGVYGMGCAMQGSRLGLLGALLVALDPRYVTHPFFPIVDNVHWPMVVWSLLTLVWCVRRPSWGRGLLTGAVAGLTTLVRSIGLYFLPLAALVLVFRGGGSRRRNVAAAAVMIAANFLVILPWTYRNGQRFGRFVLVSYDDGNPILMGNTTKEDKEKILDEIRDEVRVRPGSGVPDEIVAIERNAEARRRGLDIVRQRQPWWFYEKVLEVGPRIVRPGGWLMSRGGEDPERFGTWGVRAIAALFVSTGLGVLLLAGVGLALRRFSVADGVLWSFVAYLTLVHLATHFGPIRFHLPFFWILLLYAACLFVERARWSVGRAALLSLWFGAMGCAQVATYRSETEKSDRFEDRTQRKLDRQNEDESRVEAVERRANRVGRDEGTKDPKSKSRESRRRAEPRGRALEDPGVSRKQGGQKRERSGKKKSDGKREPLP
ncbi:MAG: hypothetical protein C4547_02945 [Phycisphaerales bacterium]|nr:MAG: hypothetical protein C4547_02945 [Phycisphaerales bacterium]